MHYKLGSCHLFYQGNFLLVSKFLSILLTHIFFRPLICALVPTVDLEGRIIQWQMSSSCMSSHIINKENISHIAYKTMDNFNKSYIIDEHMLLSLALTPMVFFKQALHGTREAAMDRYFDK